MSVSVSSSSSSDSLVVPRIFCPMNPNEEANRMGDIGDIGVGRVGVKGVKGVGGVKRVKDEGDDKGDDDKGDNDKGDDNKGGKRDVEDENDGVEGSDEVGVGRGRIRRALCVEDIVYECLIGGTSGKARARR